MVEQFRRSGLTRAAFSRQYGIPLATLSWWLAKTKRASNLPAPVVFSEVRLAPPAVTPSNAWAMEVVAPSGLTIRCREALAVRDLARLLQRHTVLSLSPATRIFVALAPVDMRRSFNGLYAHVQTVLAQDPLSGHLFLFTNKPRNRVKLLLLGWKWALGLCETS